MILHENRESGESMSKKVIQSLTFAETTVENKSGEDFPQSVGHIYDFPPEYSVLGQRLALLLMDAGVRLSEQEKLVVAFSSFLQEGRIVHDERLAGDGSRYVSVGVNPARFNELPLAERRMFILETAKQALLTVDDGTYAEDITEAMGLVAGGTEKMKLLYQRKEDGKIRVDLLLQLNDNGTCEIYSRIKDAQGSLVRQDRLEDAHCLSVAQQRCGSILIRKNKIIIKPQKNILSKHLQPIEIEYAI